MRCPGTPIVGVVDQGGSKAKALSHPSRNVSPQQTPGKDMRLQELGGRLLLPTGMKPARELAMPVRDLQYRGVLIEAIVQRPKRLERGVPRHTLSGDRRINNLSRSRQVADGKRFRTSVEDIRHQRGPLIFRALKVSAEGLANERTLGLERDR